MFAASTNSMKPSVIPAILVRSPLPLREQLEALKGRARLVQIDIVGENFLHAEEAMPFWEDFDFEFDLMTNDSLADAKESMRLGASRILIHAGRPLAREALLYMQEFRGGDYPVAVGVALPCDASVEMYEAYKDMCDFVQVMGIANEGSQGQPFDERALETVKNLRVAYPDLFIQVDGGVKGHNKDALIEAGVSRLVVGSAYKEVSGK